MPALAVAPGTIEAATARILGLIERIRMINNQLRDAGRQLDRLCKNLSEPIADKDEETSPGQKTEQRDAAILDSLPGVARTASPRCSQRLQTLCNVETIMHCGLCVGLLR